ncbi:unnamed protein product [Gadus morhua 'NCC']
MESCVVPSLALWKPFLRLLSQHVYLPPVARQALRRTAALAHPDRDSRGHAPPTCDIITPSSAFQGGDARGGGPVEGDEEDLRDVLPPGARYLQPHSTLPLSTGTRVLATHLEQRTPTTGQHRHTTQGHVPRTPSAPPAVYNKTWRAARSPSAIDTLEKDVQLKRARPQENVSVLVERDHGQISPPEAGPTWWPERRDGSWPGRRELARDQPDEVSGLRFIREYELSVSAFNSKGEGPASSPATACSKPKKGDLNVYSIKSSLWGRGPQLRRATPSLPLRGPGDHVSSGALRSPVSPSRPGPRGLPPELERSGPLQSGVGVVVSLEGVEVGVEGVSVGVGVLSEEVGVRGGGRGDGGGGRMEEGQME